MENNEKEFTEEVIDEDIVETELCPEEETDLAEVIDETEESGSSVGGLILGAAIAGAAGFVVYKALPKVKAFGKRLKKNHDEKKRQKVIEYAVNHGLATDIAEATAASLAESDVDDFEEIDENTED